MITVLGASGYTGRLVAAQLVEAGLPVQLAGRSTSRLGQLAEQLGGDQRVLQVDLREPQTLARLSGTRLLVSCAGPFTDLGRPVALFAAQRGLRYLDITNELAFVHTIYSGCHELARASGATLVPACGFEVAIADCAAALLAAELGAPRLDELAVTYQLPGAGSSYGTRASALRSLATSWLRYRGGALQAARPCVETASVRLGETTLRTLAFPSCETMTVPAHLCVEDVLTHMTITRLGALYGPWFIPAMIPLLNGPLGRVLRLLSRLSAPPPDPARRARMSFALLVSARAGQRRAELTLRGLDPYGLTAKIVAYAARQLLERDLPAGVLAPAQALDPDELLLALQSWGVEVVYRLRNIE